jgi:SAM-dependent methyltransferase
MPLPAFLREIDERVRSLRRRLESAALRKTRSLEEASKRDGECFVASIGSTVDVIDHQTEFFYVPAILPARDRVLNALSAAREHLFDAIAGQLGEPKRVLVIGAGGDVAPIKCLRRKSHEVVATDFAEDVVEVLRKKATVDAFACDLIYLDEVLPQQVDVALANATLGYIAPAKFAKAVRNVASAMKLGGVFAFDLTPHPQYFNMALETTQQTVANEGSPSPIRLLTLVRELGVRKGIAAATLEATRTSAAVNLAIVDLLRRRFEAEGFTCSTSTYSLVSAHGQKMPCLILRVARNQGTLLDAVEGERKYSTPMEALEGQEHDTVPYFMSCIDRGTGEQLAKEFGIHTNGRDDAWRVVEYLNNNPADQSAYAELLPDIHARLAPRTLADRIDEYVNGRPYVPPTPLPAAVLFDQYTRKMVLTRSVPVSKEEADFRIDLGYQRAAANPAISAAELAKPPPEFSRLSNPTPSRSAAKVGRNDPCPCGSGQKFKKCHGQ